MHRSTTLMTLLLTAMLAAACGDDVDLPPVAPTPIDPTSEIFEATLTPLGAKFYVFSTQNAGVVIATLTEIQQLDPELPTVVGMDLGTWTGVFCQVTVARPITTQGTVVTATATGAGNLCVRVYDVLDAGLPASVTFKVTVSHF